MNFPGWLELPMTGQIVMVPNLFEPLKFNCMSEKGIPMSAVLLVAGKIKL